MPRKRKRPSSSARRGRAESAPAPKRAPGGSGAPAHPIRSLDNWLLGLAGLGVLLTGYLTLVAWFGEHPAYCGVDSECDIVQSSRWSTLFGLPMALWGLLTYALLAGLAWRLRSRPSAWAALFLVTCVGFGVSWFLTLVSVFEIGATCEYCLASFALMNLLFLLAVLRRPSGTPARAWRSTLLYPVSAALVLVLGLHLHFSGLFDPAAGPEDPYLEALATHLQDSGARFYGAYWCRACQEQKALFTASAKRLPYTECAPSGPNGPLTAACTIQDIRRYPTWIVDGRRLTGVVDVERLARASKFKWDATTQEKAPKG